MACQAPAAHVRALGQFIQRRRRDGIGAQDFEKFGHSPIGSRSDRWSLDQLRLSARALRGDDKTARYPVCFTDPANPAKQMQAAIQTRSDTGGRQDAAFVHEQRSRIDRYTRIAGREGLCVCSMGRCAPPIQQSGLGKPEGSQAQAHDDGSSSIGRLQLGNDIRQYGLVHAPPTR